MRWGATDEEVAGPYPGAELIPDGQRAATMAVTIDAPPDQVWPWLVQMGGDRGGWYSWDRLDNRGRPSAREVHPEWQDLALGDHVKYATRTGPVDAWEVAALEPNRFLGLRGLSDLRGHRLDPKQPRPSAYTEGLWGFLLKELPGGRTRLVISGYQAVRPRWLERFTNYWLYIPLVWPMQARMLAVLKRNIEQAAKAPPQTILSGTRAWPAGTNGTPPQQAGSRVAPAHQPVTSKPTGRGWSPQFPGVSVNHHLGTETSSLTGHTAWGYSRVIAGKDPRALAQDVLTCGAAQCPILGAA